MFVNLKINMFCNNNIINVIKTNLIYGKLNFEINNNYEYICKLICYYVDCWKNIRVDGSIRITSRLLGRCKHSFPKDSNRP